MEEDINILESLLEYNGFIRNASDNTSEFEVYMNKNDYTAIEHLIARNKELEHKLQIKSKLMSEKDLDNIIRNSVSDYDCLIEELYNFFGYYQEPFINEENYIPKSKVREKIEKLQKLLEEENWGEKTTLGFKNRIVVLQELLEDNYNHIPRID